MVKSIIIDDEVHARIKSFATEIKEGISDTATILILEGLDSKQHIADNVVNYLRELKEIQIGVKQ